MIKTTFFAFFNEISLKKSTKKRKNLNFTAFCDPSPLRSRPSAVFMVAVMSERFVGLASVFVLSNGVVFQSAQVKQTRVLVRVQVGRVEFGQIVWPGTVGFSHYAAPVVALVFRFVLARWRCDRAWVVVDAASLKILKNWIFNKVEEFDDIFWLIFLIKKLK